MRHLPKLHLFALVLAWILGMTWGPAGILAITAVLAIVELIAWRADLMQFDRFRRSWRLPGRDRDSGPVPSYDAVRHAITMGAHSRREFDFGMRRRLERIAAVRLDSEHGVDMHRDQDAAQRLLGADVWELLDPRRPVSGERSAGGVRPDQLRMVVDRLEGL